MSTLRTNELQSLDDSVTVQVVDLLDATNALPYLASSETGKGDALVGVKQPFSGSANRTQHDKNADVINLRDAAGIDNTGATNCTAAVQAALNSFGVKGGVVYIGNGDRFLISSITVPQNVTISGSLHSPGEAINSASQTYTSFGSQFILAAGATITLARSSVVRNMSIISASLVAKLPVTNDATATAAIAAFAGTAFTSVEADFQLRDMLVIGFQYPVFANPTATDTGRRILENFKYDCTNGPYISYATDIDRFRGVHGWPFLTAHVSGLSASKNNRSGVGFTLNKVADFAFLDCCFNYGYNTGFAFQGVWNVTVNGGGADAVQTTGVSYTGNCRFSRINNFIINSNNTGINVNITQNGENVYNPDIKTSNCIINGVNYGVYVTAGAYYSLNDTFMGDTGIAYSDGTVGGGVFNPLFDGVTTPVNMTTAAEAIVSRGKFNYSTSQSKTTLGEKTFATQSIFIDPRALAVGTGHFLEQGGVLSSGRMIGTSRTGPRLTNGSAGTEQADWTYTAFNKGVWVDRIVMTGDGVLRPVADGIQLLGGPANRWGQIYSSVGSISTSDEDEKEDISDISDAILDAWSNVNFAMYKFKDSVESKGADARIHFGLIAQRVKAAFEKAGLDPFAYGILCYDEWDAVVEQKDDDGNVTAPAREAGSRYGIRYDEAWILECALMRRTVASLKS